MGLLHHSAIKPHKIKLTGALVDYPTKRSQMSPKRRTKHVLCIEKKLF